MKLMGPFLLLTLFSAHANIQKVDADRDGIADAMDKCPLTPGTSKVNAYGCTKGERVVLSIDVVFATNSTVIGQQYRQQVFTLADFLKRHQEVNVELGYANGDEAHTQELSLKRAEAIKEMLVKDYKIKPERVQAVGRGESDRNSPHKGAEGRYRNRKVEAYILQ